MFRNYQIVKYICSFCFYEYLDKSQRLYIMIDKYQRLISRSTFCEIAKTSGNKERLHRTIRFSIMETAKKKRLKILGKSCQTESKFHDSAQRSFLCLPFELSRRNVNSESTTMREFVSWKLTFIEKKRRRNDGYDHEEVQRSAETLNAFRGEKDRVRRSVIKINS